MSAAPRVSVIVPSRTGEASGLRAQLACQSLRHWELIVNTHPSSPGHARNVGAAEAKGQWLIFLDDDVHLGHEHLLTDLLEALKSRGPQSVIGVPCRLMPHATRFQRWQFQALFTDHRSNGAAPLTEVSWRDSVNGRCMAMRRETFEALGGFDPRLPSSEEPELLYRLSQQGGRVYMLWSGWVTYAPPATLSEAVRKTVWYERGNSQFARKHPHARHRLALRNRWQAAAYLLARTLGLLPLFFLKVSYHHRRPRVAWRPLAALLSYLGAWAYCASWFASEPRHSR